MNSKLYIYIVAIGSILGGVSTIISPKVVKNDFLGVFSPKGGDVTPIKWPLGSTFIIIGSVIIYREYKKNRKKQPIYSICPKCKEAFYYNELKDGKCKYCEDVDTIGIEEYYKN